MLTLLYSNCYNPTSAILREYRYNLWKESTKCVSRCEYLEDLLHLDTYFVYLDHEMHQYNLRMFPWALRCEWSGVTIYIYIYIYIYTYLLTPWCRVLLEKLTGLQLVKKIPRISLNPKVHYRTHKRLPPVSILGQPSPVHIPTSHLLKIHPNIIHPSTPRSPLWSPSLRFPEQDPNIYIVH